MEKIVSKKDLILKELSKHDKGITIRQLATVTEINSKTIAKWLHRLVYENKAEFIQFGSAYAFYPIKQEVKTRKNEK